MTGRGRRSLKQATGDFDSPCVDVGPVAEVAVVTAYQPEDRSAYLWELQLVEHTNPAAWYEQQPTIELLGQSRADFGDIVVDNISQL